jgi:prevent-host-death family protein
MKTINMHEAKTHLSRLIDEAVTTGEPFIIAKAGKPMVTVTAHQPEKPARRKLGTLNGQFLIPDDFDTMFQDEIIRLFEGEDEGEPKVRDVLNDLRKVKE